MNWDATKGKVNLKIMPSKSVKVKVIFNEVFHKVRNKEIAWNKNINGIEELELVAGKVCSIELG